MVVKMKRKSLLLATLLCLSTLTFVFTPVFADPASVTSVECASSMVYGSTTSCTVYGYAAEGVDDVLNLSATTSNLSLNSFSPGGGLVNLSTITNQINVSGISAKSGDFAIGTFHITASANGGTGTITVGSITTEISIVSTNNNLSNITVSPGTLSPAFQSDRTTYNVNAVNSSSIVIGATASSSAASVTGSLGRQDLVCNTDRQFPITVTAQSGVQKTYYVSAYRTCSNDSSLRELSISAGSINFNKNTKTYNINVDNRVSSFTATGAVNNGAASISYSPSQTINLNVGKNTLRINVTAETGSMSTYTLNINRAGQQSNPSASSDSSLSELSVSGANINFNKEVYEYITTVPYETEKVTVSGKTSDSKAKIDITQLDKLVVGDNKITITITAEDGSKSVYTVTIKRQEENAAKLDDDSTLLGIVVNDQYYVLNDNKTALKIKINNTIQKINVVPVPTKKTSKSSIVFSGDEIGDNDEVRINVTAEDGSMTTYILKFSFPYKTIKEQVEQEQEPPYWLIILVGLVSLAAIGFLVYLILTTKDEPTNTPLPPLKTPTPPQRPAQQPVQPAQPTAPKPVAMPPAKPVQPTPQPVQKPIQPAPQPVQKPTPTIATTPQLKPAEKPTEKVTHSNQPFFGKKTPKTYERWYNNQ